MKLAPQVRGRYERHLRVDPDNRALDGLTLLDQEALSPRGKLLFPNGPNLAAARSHAGELVMAGGVAFRRNFLCRYDDARDRLSGRIDDRAGHGASGTQHHSLLGPLVELEMRQWHETGSLDKKHARSVRGIGGGK